MNQTLKVTGMTCNHCKAHVEKALLKVGGVQQVEVNLEKGEAVVAGSAGREDLIKAVEDAGYSAD
ncbi:MULTISPECIES: heavy-metal-associated domain-containing protein [Desulfitobacterium]|uniref:Copper chaperone n=1 Tax=Desulfitobacterium dehalogenans (strain ATCC 51507 / DSM 9161 / JW/IU-DC1) TaxID=756499 RepID=I4ABT2_DESDJ|nr:MULTISPECIES: heavy metal-associated domain-containing protein [Desulfitobacterium]AFM01417.1 copper chaperone [Desulfitobacterium dehalogenans ATCC 51507]